MWSSQSSQPYHVIKIGNETFRASIGRTGVRKNKKEGDGGTPLAELYLREIYYRPDKIDPKEIITEVPVKALTKIDGWVDDPKSPQYNKFVTLPPPGAPDPEYTSHEDLWLKDPNDRVYDIIGVLSYNENPVLNEGKGSAIFLHIARENYSPTVGCIALSKEDLLKFLAMFSKDNQIKTNLNGDSEVLGELKQPRLRR